MRPKPIVPSLKFPVPQIVEPKPGKIPVTQPQTLGLRPPEGPLPGGSSPDLSSGSPEPANPTLGGPPGARAGCKNATSNN